MAKEWKGLLDPNVNNSFMIGKVSTLSTFKDN